MSGHPVVVAGAVPHVWIKYPLLAEQATRGAKKQTEGLILRKGGAHLLERLLQNDQFIDSKALVGPTELQNGEDTSGATPIAHSLIHTIFKDDKSRDESIYKVENIDRFRISTQWQYPRSQPGLAKVLTLLSSENDARDSDDVVNFFRSTRTQWCVYQMAQPLATGSLWDQVRCGPMNEDGKPDANRLVVVVNADDLRAEGVELSRHLSWEKTTEDLIRQLGAISHLGSLVTTAYVVVRFGSDGVVVHRGRGDATSWLLFDPSRLENDFELSNPSEMVEITTAFTAGLTVGLSRMDGDDIESAVRYGFAAARRLAKQGFRNNMHDNAPDFVAEQVMHHVKPDSSIAAVEIPSRDIAAGVSWSIFHDTMGDAQQVARQIVQVGPSLTLARIPTSRFGQFVAVDRNDIETFEATSKLIKDWSKHRPNHNLCIGAFGRPGAGKSFAISQVVESALQHSNAHRLTFDISQFTSMEDMTLAFHSIRDWSTKGYLPLVFFHKCDSAFAGQSFAWLRRLCDAMRRGSFMDRGIERPLTPGIFVFIPKGLGAFADISRQVQDLRKLAPIRDWHTSAMSDKTSSNNLALGGNPQSSDSFEILSDFLSVLHVYVDVRGPDPSGKTDDMFPIRRAFIFRSLLQKREPKIYHDETVSIDETVLNGFLTVPTYRHGVYSMQKLLQLSSITGKTNFQRSHLPSEMQIALHVDSKAFVERIRSPRLPEALRDRIAQGLYQRYKAIRFEMAETQEEKEKLKADPAICGHWNDLADHYQESTRSQADDIPRKLRLLNYYMAPEVPGRPTIDRFTDAQLEFLSEIEHERFVSERLQKHWRLSNQKDFNTHKSPFLIPWVDLEKKWRHVDSVMVECVPTILAENGYRIYQLGKGAE